MNNNQELERLAKKIRRDIWDMLVDLGGGHFGGAYSCVEILVTLYFKILKNKDKFILSKAHASVALYSVLSKKGIIDKDILRTYGKKDSCLGVHAEKHSVPGVEFSCGSLGHGLAYAAGIALANKLKNEKDRVFVLLGDGECQEGSVWETAMFAAHHKLNNLVAIIDNNKLQSGDRIENIIEIEPFAEKWKAFGWKVIQANGHDINGLINAFKASSESNNKPVVIIAHTVKGKGLSFMESLPRWHYGRPNEEELKITKEELRL